MWQQGLFDDIDEDVQWAGPQDYPKLHGEITLDLECHDPLLKEYGPGWPFAGKTASPDKHGFVTGVALQNGDGVDNYWPVRHSDGGLPHVFAWLKDELANPDLTVKVYGAEYDLGWLRANGVRVAGKIIDVARAVPLLDENRFSYSLDDVCKDWLGSNKDYASLVHHISRGLGLKKKDATAKKVMRYMRDAPAWAVQSYARMDVRLTNELWQHCKPRMDAEELWDIFGLETEVIPVLLDMRANGVRVNVAKAEQLSIRYAGIVEECQSEIRRLVGRSVRLWESEDVANALKKVGIQWSEVTDSGDVSVKSKSLESNGHPLAMLIAKARKYDKAKGTFIDGHILGHAVNGRIHAVFSALRNEGGGGSVGGRFSSDSPNFQNLPARDEDIAADARGLFEPEEGDQWASSDYSGQEPRIAVHFAFISGIAGVQTFVDAFRENPKLNFHAKGMEITGLSKPYAKNMTLGKMYGMGAVKLCHSLGLPTIWHDGKEYPGPEGLVVMRAYDASMPWVKGLSDLCTRTAERRNWIRTLLGRRLRFRKQDASGAARDPRDRGAFPYKALNRLIQGSAADMMKRALVNLWKAGIRLLATVHDEACSSVKNQAEGRIAQQIMCDAVTLSIPMTTDLEMGPDWGHIEKV